MIQKKVYWSSHSIFLLWVFFRCSLLSNQSRFAIIIMLTHDMKTTIKHVLVRVLWLHFLLSPFDISTHSSFDKICSVIYHYMLLCLWLQYTYLLTSQLESQRRYFEEKIAAVELECAEKLAKSEEEFNSVVRSKSLDSQEIQQLLKSKEQAEKKCEQVKSLKSWHDLGEKLYFCNSGLIQWKLCWLGGV